MTEKENMGKEGALKKTARYIALSVITAALMLPAVARPLRTGALLRIEMSESLLPLKNPATLSTLIEPRVDEILYPDAPPAADPNARPEARPTVLRLTPVAENQARDLDDQSVLLSLRIDLTGVDNPPVTAAELQDRIIEMLSRLLTGYYNQQVSYLQQRQQAVAAEAARAEQQLLTLRGQLPASPAPSAQIDVAPLQQELAEIELNEQTAAEQLAFLQRQVNALLATLQAQYETDPLIGYLEETIEFYVVVLEDLEDEPNISPYEAEKIAFLRDRLLDAQLERTQRQNYLTEDYEGPQIRQYYNEMVELNLETARLQNRRQFLTQQIEQAAPPAETDPNAEPLRIRAEAQAAELQRLLEQVNRIQSRLNLITPPQIIVIGG